MLRHLNALLLSLSLATTAFTATTADARAFARPPAAETAAKAATPAKAETPARAKLRAALKARRAKNVAAFRAYVERGVYPHNFFTSDALNVWIDMEGRMCAAATMIWQSGAKQLVRQTARDANFVQLGEVTSGALLDWMLTSGLTQAEVALIQEPFIGRPLPVEPVIISDDWRLAEDARLRARYAEVLAALDADPDASLDAAVDALAAHPELAATLL